MLLQYSTFCYITGKTYWKLPFWFLDQPLFQAQQTSWRNTWNRSELWAIGIQYIHCTITIQFIPFNSGPVGYGLLAAMIALWNHRWGETIWLTFLTKLLEGLIWMKWRITPSTHSGGLQPPLVQTREPLLCRCKVTLVGRIPPWPRYCYEIVNICIYVYMLS